MGANKDIEKKPARFGVSNSQTVQNTETATDRCSAVTAVSQKHLF